MKLALLVIALALFACAKSDPPAKPKPVPCTIAKDNTVVFDAPDYLAQAREYRDKEGATSAARYVSGLGPRARVLPAGTTCEFQNCALFDSATIRVTSGPHAGVVGSITPDLLSPVPACNQSPPK